MKIRLGNFGILHALGQAADSFWSTLCSQPGLLPGDGRFALPEFYPEQSIGEDRLRRMDRFSQMLTVALKQALAGPLPPGKSHRFGMVTSTHFGPFESIIRFSTRIYEAGPQRANPMEFPNTVINAATGHACIETGLQGYNDTVAGPGSLAAAYDALILKRADQMAAAGVEELGIGQRQVLPVFQAPGPEFFNLATNATLYGEGAAAVILESVSADRPAQEACVYMLGYVSGFFATGAFGGGEIGPQAAGPLRAMIAKTGMLTSEIGGVILVGDGSLATDQGFAHLLSGVFGQKGMEVPLFALTQRTGYVFGAGEILAAFCAKQIIQTGLWPQPAWLWNAGQVKKLPPGKVGILAHPVILVLHLDPFGVCFAYLFSYQA